MEQEEWKREEEGRGGRKSRRHFRDVQGEEHSSKAVRVRGAQGPGEPGGRVPALRSVIADLPQIFALRFLLPHLQPALGCASSQEVLITQGSHYSR